ncbi:hypothetical protein I4U23_006261 [Adineta vaga]|nr:hypothetical protein I4U23_006261 [Adineta vaga]
MEWFIIIQVFVYFCLIITPAQILYQCNFDTSISWNNCLKGLGAYRLSIGEKKGTVSNDRPTGPLSDVTSSLKPTENGKNCSLPYKITPYTWDMYFCNNGYCQTDTNLNSKCQSGKFGYYDFSVPRRITFTLNTVTGGADSAGEQCLIYYYYLPNIDVYSCVTITFGQILYECNFDTATIDTSCLVRDGFLGILVTDKMGNAGTQAPTTPLSDVTSSLKPTDNGKNCSLPYKITPYTWHMYFCNNGYCQTDTDPNSKCQSGKFGHFTLTTVGSSITFTLNIDSNGINGTGHQCLTYFYYLPNISNTNQNIKVRVQETGDDSKLIDTVTNSPHNGWIERRISYETVKTGYKMYFDLGKTSGFPGPLSTIAFDEISIVVGKCQDESITTTSTTPNTISVSSSHTPSTIRTTTVTSISPSMTSTSMSTTVKITTATTERITSTRISTTIKNTTSTLQTTTQLTTKPTSSTSQNTSTTTHKNVVTPDRNTTVIILAAVLTVISVTLIGILMWIKKSSIMHCCARLTHGTSSNNRIGISPSALELNRVAPA